MTNFKYWMMRLTGISVAGYRGFRDRVTLELKPLVLLYGRNNAGKSSLLRLPSIVARSVSDSAVSPFDLSGPEGRGAHFLDVLWRGDNLRRLQLELHWEDDENSFTDVFVIRYEDARNQTYVSRFELRDSRGDVSFSMEAQAYPDESSYDSEQYEGVIRPGFVGLVPENSSEIPVLARLASRLRLLRYSTTWLESVRARPQRLGSMPGGVPRQMSPDGGNAGQILISRPDEYEAVRSWFANAEVRRDLRLEPFSPTTFRILLNPVGQQVRQVDIADTGEGMSQVFPVLVGLELARRAGSTGILAVEDPEAHLHGDARRALARRFCEVAASTEPPSTILETHSRTFLLGVQIAIAEGAISPEDVLVYWMDQTDEGASEAVVSSFTREGAPTSSVLQGVLAEDMVLARTLVQLQAARVP
jgi:hypothetical protein